MTHTITITDSDNYIHIMPNGNLTSPYGSHVLSNAGFQWDGKEWTFGHPTKHQCSHNVGKDSKAGIRCNTCRIIDLEKTVGKILEAIGGI